MSITRYRGDTNPIRGYAAINGLPLDVTGCSFTLTVNQSKAPTTSATNRFSLTGVVVDVLTGELAFPITEEQADQLPGRYYYDIQMTDALGFKTTIALDRFVFLQDISK